MRSEKLIGLPVVHIDLGKRCGTVQALILDPKARRVAGIVVSLGGWRKRGLLPIERVYAAGDQAVTIEDEEAITSAEEESELRALWQRKLDLVGMQVLTVTGRGLGSVDAFEFSLDGSIETLYVGRSSKRRRPRGRRNTIPGAMVRSFGEDAVIVAAEAEEWLEAEPADERPVSTVAFEVEESSGSEQKPDSLANRVMDRLAHWGRRTNKDEPEPTALEGTPPSSE